MKILQKAFCFLGNCILIGRWELSLLCRELLLSAANVLKNTPKIPDLTKRDVL